MEGREQNNNCCIFSVKQNQLTKMKKCFMFASALLCTSAVLANHSKLNNRIEILSKEAVSVTISITADGKPVKGALVRITSSGMAVGAATSDETGKAAISLPTYGKQLVTIQVSHAMYKDQKLAEIVLENGATFDFVLKSKTESAEMITTESQEKVAKIEEKTAKSEEKTTEYETDAEKLAREREEAVRSQEQLRKEREEAERIATEKKKAAEEKQNTVEKTRETADKERSEAERIKQEAASTTTEEAKRREAEAKQRQQEEAERLKTLEGSKLTDAKAAEDKAKQEAAQKQKEQEKERSEAEKKAKE